MGGNEKIALHCLTCCLRQKSKVKECKSLACSLQRDIDFLILFSFRLLCVYQGKHLSQDSSTSVEDEEADSASDESDGERDEIDNYGDSFVDDCGVVATTDKVEFTVDHNFTLRGEHSDVVGRCFMEVYFPSRCRSSVQTCEA